LHGSESHLIKASALHFFIMDVKIFIEANYVPVAAISDADIQLTTQDFHMRLKRSFPGLKQQELFDALAELGYIMMDTDMAEPCWLIKKKQSFVL